MDAGERRGGESIGLVERDHFDCGHGCAAKHDAPTAREQESLRFREAIGEPVVLDMAESVARTLPLEAVTAEIDALEDHFLGPLVKRYFEGLSYREIAEALDCKPGR